MGAIHLTLTSGRSSSWFSDRLSARLAAGGSPLLVGLALIVLLALVGLGAFTLNALQPLHPSVAQIETVVGVAQGVSDARLKAERFVLSGSPTDFNAGERAFIEVVNGVNARVDAAATGDHYAWQQLETTSVEYLNTFRSLGSLMRSGSAPQTQAVLRNQLNDLDHALDRQLFTLLRQDINATGQTVEALGGAVTGLTALAVIALAGLFVGAALVLSSVTRGRAVTLSRMTQAAESLADGQFDTRLEVSPEVQPDLRPLMAAFNRLGEHVKHALRSESAAQEQNRVQVLKLARQEQMTAILEERHRIARELHDSVKQQLFSITLSAGAALNMVDHAPKVVKTHLEHIGQAGHHAQAEMTALLQELVPVSLQDKRLEEALLATLTPLCDTHNLKLIWRVDGTNTLTIAQEHALFRAVQEAVTNVLRHSGATVLRVSITFGLVTQIVVEDNGSGFDAEKIAPTSTGLAMMRARLKRVGGRAEFTTAPGQGTRLTLYLDLRRKN